MWFIFRDKQHSGPMYLKCYRGKKIPFLGVFELRIGEGSPDLVLSGLLFGVWRMRIQSAFLCCCCWYWSIHACTEVWHYNKFPNCLFCYLVILQVSINPRRILIITILCKCQLRSHWVHCSIPGAARVSDCGGHFEERQVLDTRGGYTAQSH